MTYCCEKMERWSHTQEKYPKLMHHTGLRLMVGIVLHEGRNAFVSIAYCPWCGTKISEVEDSLIGRPMAEGTIGPA